MLHTKNKQKQFFTKQKLEEQNFSPIIGHFDTCQQKQQKVCQHIGQEVKKKKTNNYYQLFVAWKKALVKQKTKKATAAKKYKLEYF